MRLRLLIAATAFALTTAHPVLGQSSFSAGQIRGLLEQRVGRDHRAIGMVVGVIDEDGRAFHSFGEACEGGTTQPLDENTVFEVGSLTKPFTAALMNRLAVRGEVDPQAQIDGGLRSLGVTTSTPSGRVTFQQLADHTSGLPVMPTNLTDDSRYARADLVGFLETFTPADEPGARRSYSNLGYGLLGLLLEDKAGQPYSLLLQQQLLQPLGLASSGLELQQGSLACGHDEALNPLAPTRLSDVFQPAGGLLSTPRDMMTFLAASMGLEGPFRPQWGRLQDVRGRQLVVHDGSTNGFAAYMGYDPERRRGVVVLSNSHFLTNDLALHLLQSDYPLVPKRHAVTLRPEQAAALEGGYAGGGDQVTIAALGQRLFLIRAQQPIRELFAEDARHFFLDESRPVQFSDAGVTLFQRDGLSQTLPLAERGAPVFRALPAGEFDGLAGRYRLDPESVIELRHRDDRFFAQITGQGELEILPLGSDRFRYLQVAADIVVDRGSGHLSILQGAEETKAVHEP